MNNFTQSNNVKWYQTRSGIGAMQVLLCGLAWPLLVVPLCIPTEVNSRWTSQFIWWSTVEMSWFPKITSFLSWQMSFMADICTLSWVKQSSVN